MGEAAVPVGGWRLVAEMHDAIEINRVYLAFGIHLAEGEYLAFGLVPVLGAVMLQAQMKTLEILTNGFGNILQRSGGAGA